jgi:xanthine/CO dehydrogenase XdhC/CoxF family maturation factor
MNPPPSYIGVIGSNRNVLRAIDELKQRNLFAHQNVYAPIRLDIAAERK